MVTLLRFYCIDRCYALYEVVKHFLDFLTLLYSQQLNDCHRGVVFDGLETLFAQNQHTAASAVLKSLNNRRFIYFLTLKHDYNHLKEQEKKEQEEKGNTMFMTSYFPTISFTNVTLESVYGTFTNDCGHNVCVAICLFLNFNLAYIFFLYNIQC